MHQPPQHTVPRKGDALLDAVLDAAASLIIAVDVKGRIVCWNRACERLSGYTADELTLEDILERLVPEDEHPTAMGVLDALARGESPVTVEVHWRTRNGDVRLIAWSCTGLTEPDGTVSHVVATGIDVTERRRLE